ncbi:endonuclease domain-containing protein [Streptomyces sp. NPDC001307]|uniref:endonuclease domain-containing protein n=1 Tax=Streptomyces sp. NPDC001307 TaxID=3364560 RepID=UPI00369AA922
MTKGMCRTHYAQHRRGGGLAPIDVTRARSEGRTCAFDGCVRAVSASGFCTGHYQQSKKGQSLSRLRRKRGNGVVKEMVRRGIVECRGCGVSKPVSAYSTLNASGALRPYCKPCNAERVRFGRYNLTKAFGEPLREFQQARCAVCGTDSDGRTLHIDHDHACCPGRRSCGECMRGLVCSNCNAYGLAWYEGLRAELRTFDVLNQYLADPPAKRLRAER